MQVRQEISSARIFQVVQRHAGVKRCSWKGRRNVRRCSEYGYGTEEKLSYMRDVCSMARQAHGSSTHTPSKCFETMDRPGSKVSCLPSEPSSLIGVFNGGHGHQIAIYGVQDAEEASRPFHCAYLDNSKILKWKEKLSTTHFQTLDGAINCNTRVMKRKKHFSSFLSINQDMMSNVSSLGIPE